MMKKINEDMDFKPTLDKPVNNQSNEFEKNFNDTMKRFAPDIILNEIDGMLSESERSLKKKLFNLTKMESLVFSDPKLSAVYEKMAKDGKEKYGYHYNETIMNIIFNDYVLNSPKYLQKYKMAIPKKKKRRDKSGINQLKKAGEERIEQTIVKKQPEKKPEIRENSEPLTKVMFLINDKDPENVNLFAYFPEEDFDDNGNKVGYSYIGQHIAIKPNYVEESRPATPEEYTELKSKLESIGYNLDVINLTNETTGAASSGAYSGSVAWKKDLMKEPKNVEETTTSASSGQYSTKYAWGKGDLIRGKESLAMHKPIWRGGTIIRESDCLTDALNSNALKKKKISTAKERKAHNEFYMKETDQSIIAKPSSTMANYAQSTSELGSNVPMGSQTKGGIGESKDKEDVTLFDELNKELNAYSIHHKKLMQMIEVRKPSALVLRDRLGVENETNFKKDLSQSNTNKIIDIEKELQWKDQQTNVKNPQKLSQDIEKTEIELTDAKSGEALKNVGDSTNDKGDEIPKRNLTTKEQEEVDMYRLGQHSLVYDNEPSERFEKRMKKDMGDDIYKMRQKQLEFRSKAPLYNKDTQPIENGINKVQFNKEKSGWNEREGIKESIITGRYIDALGKKHIIDFKLGEVKISESHGNLFPLDFTGLGNKYNCKIINNKVIVNEDVINIMNSHKFFTDGKSVIAVRNHVKVLSEDEKRDEKAQMNERINKMKHLLSYNPQNYINTANVKKNRGF